jgi:protein TonB
MPVWQPRQRPARGGRLALVAAAHAGLLAWAWAQSLAAPAAGAREPAVLLAQLLSHREPAPAAEAPLPTPRAALPQAPALAVPEPPLVAMAAAAATAAAAPPPAPAAVAAPTTTPAAPMPEARSTPVATALVAPPAAPRHTPADHAGCADVPHPLALRERGIEGLVQLRVQVGSDGRARQVQLLGSSGWRLFDEAALAKARSCRFRPAFEGDSAVESWVEFPVRFALTQS